MGDAASTPESKLTHIELSVEDEYAAYIEDLLPTEIAKNRRVDRAIDEHHTVDGDHLSVFGFQLLDDDTAPGVTSYVSQPSTDDVIYEFEEHNDEAPDDFQIDNTPEESEPDMSYEPPEPVSDSVQFSRGSKPRFIRMSTHDMTDDEIARLDSELRSGTDWSLDPKHVESLLSGIQRVREERGLDNGPDRGEYRRPGYLVGERRQDRTWREMPNRPK